MSTPALWDALAIALLVLGGGLAWFSLRGDRARSRLRCPRCWYDMAGISPDDAGRPRCPECGHHPRSLKALSRARRRWRLAIVSATLLLASYAASVTPRVRAGGWGGAVPTWAMIVGLPWLPEPLLTDKGRARRVDASLLGRYKADRKGWQEQWTHARARGIVARGRTVQEIANGLPFLKHREDDELAHRAVLIVAEAVARSPETRAAAMGVRWGHHWPLDLLPGTIDHLVPGLTAGLDDPAPYAAEHCIMYLEQCGTAAEPAVGRLIEMLRVPRRMVRSSQAMMALLKIASKSALTRGKLLDALATSSDPAFRGACIVALGTEGVKDDRVTAALLVLLAGDDPSLSRRAARSLGGWARAALLWSMPSWHNGTRADRPRKTTSPRYAISGRTHGNTTMS